MLKILHVITTIERGGAEIQLLTLVRHQVDLGNEVFVHYLKGRPELGYEFESAQVTVLPPSRFFISNHFRLVKILRLRFDITHAHLPRAEIQLALARLFTRSKRPSVCSRHNSENFFPSAPRLLSRKLSRLTLDSYSGVVFISSAVKEFVTAARELPLNTKSVVIHYGYDDRIQNSNIAESTKDRSKTKFLFVGRLTEQKNIPLLISAFKIHLSKSPESELHIYGSGKLEMTLKSSAIDIRDRVFWHAKSSNLNELMCNFSCLILPSKYEGFGLVLLEAMQNDLPIIGSNVSAIPEVLGSQHPGLFSTESATNLSEKLDKICSTSLSLDILKYQRARLEHFNPYKMAKAMQNFYAECAQSL